MLIPNQGDRDLPSYTKPNDVHFQYSKNETSHTYQTSSPARKRRICGVSRQTRTYITLIDLQHFFTLYTFYLFSSHHFLHTMESFRLQHSHVVLNIKHTVADGFRMEAHTDLQCTNSHLLFTPLHIHLSDPSRKCLRKNVRTFYV